MEGQINPKLGEGDMSMVSRSSKALATASKEGFVWKAGCRKPLQVRWASLCSE